MKLDRHNYEEFFLLYVDNELTTEQRSAVELFVQENPDLAIELEILQQTVLPADDSIVFEHKQSLLRTGSNSLINISNYEEYLLSYIDGELNETEKNEFEKFAMANPQVKEELSIYQQIKLEPEEEIVFKNKEVLYRKEEKVRVISIQWRRYAVAAAVLLIAGIGTIAILNNKPNGSTDGTVVKVKPATENNTGTNNSGETKTVEEKVKEKIIAPATEETKTDNIAVASKDNVNKNNAALQKENEAGMKKNSNKVQQAGIDANEIAQSQVPVVKQVVPNPIKNNNTMDVEDRTAPAIVDANTNKNTIAATDKNAVKQNSNENSVTNNPEIAYNNKEVDHIDQMEFDKEYASNNESKNRKLRGFFRKATRVFEKRTNISATDDNEERVMIGALAVKLK